MVLVGDWIKSTVSFDPFSFRMTRVFLASNPSRYTPSTPVSFFQTFPSGKTRVVVVFVALVFDDDDGVAPKTAITFFGPPLILKSKIYCVVFVFFILCNFDGYIKDLTV